MRRAAKRDDNHAEIRDALRKAGCGVVDLGAVGNGCPDLLAHGPTWPHRMALLEVKDSAKAPSARKLTKDQQDFHAKWRGPIWVVTTPTEALEAMGIRS